MNLKLVDLLGSLFSVPPPGQLLANASESGAFESLLQQVKSEHAIPMQVQPEVPLTEATATTDESESPPIAGVDEASPEVEDGEEPIVEGAAEPALETPGPPSHRNLPTVALPEPALQHAMHSNGAPFVGYRPTAEVPVAAAESNSDPVIMVAAKVSVATPTTAEPLGVPPPTENVATTQQSSGVVKPLPAEQSAPSAKPISVVLPTHEVKSPVAKGPGTATGAPVRRGVDVPDAVTAGDALRRPPVQNVPVLSDVVRPVQDGAKPVGRVPDALPIIVQHETAESADVHVRAPRGQPAAPKPVDVLTQRPSVEPNAAHKAVAMPERLSRGDIVSIAVFEVAFEGAPGKRAAERPAVVAAVGERAAAQSAVDRPIGKRAADQPGVRAVTPPVPPAEEAFLPTEGAQHRAARAVELLTTLKEGKSPSVAPERASVKSGDFSAGKTPQAPVQPEPAPDKPVPVRPESDTSRRIDPALTQPRETPVFLEALEHSAQARSNAPASPHAGAETVPTASRAVDGAAQLAVASSSRPVATDPVVQTAVQHVRHLVTSGDQTVVVKLVPESLGELQVTVKSSRGTLEVVLSTANHQVRQTLEHQIHALRETLVREGIDITKATVTMPVATDNDVQTSFTRAGGGSSPQSGGERHHANQSYSGSHSRDPDLPQQNRRSWNPHNGRLNVFA